MNYPTKVTVGKSFGLKGIVRSDSGDFTEVRGVIKDANGNIVMDVKEAITGKEYDISPGKVNHDLVFGDLAIGKYTYILSVVGEEFGEYIVAEHEFEIVKKAASTPKPTATPKPTTTPSSGGSTASATPTPVPSKGTVYAKTGNVDVTYENKDITVKVTVGKNGLSGNNDRAAVLVGNKAANLLGDMYKEATEAGWQWVVVHIEVDLGTVSGVGNYADCVPGIIIRAQDGSKLNGVDVPYYVLTLDANGYDYNNNNSYKKYYDIAFQIPSGVTMFDMTFGDGNNKLVYEHK